ncbi:hypothetical protein LIS66_04000 [Pseudomonas sp. HN2]|uniref:hypothetical protein n=1 Tax=Pseudomonas sp. HN2 TaxID=2884805 RepID=UPI001D157142|nr:hypothetical protein [Pseudomonas sp. HN2]UEB96740.1 hypothetical protein LIS66_04000 [Pseudomonas sp. HN2]
MTNKGVATFTAKKNSGTSKEPLYFRSKTIDNELNFAAVYLTDEIYAISFWLHHLDDIKAGKTCDLVERGPDREASVIYKESATDDQWLVNSGGIKIEYYDLAGEIVKASFEFSVTSTTGVVSLITGYVSIDGFLQLVPSDIQEKLKNMG